MHMICIVVVDIVLYCDQVSCMARLERNTLSEQLAAEISKEITAGVWTERLPGHRILGKRYDVSRPTCERALNILEANGLISPAEPGKMRKILRKESKKAASDQLHLLVVIDSRHPPTQEDAALILQIEDFWKSEGGQTSRVQCDLMRIRKPAYLLKKWISASGANCVFFDTITLEWVKAVETFKLPCYATGGSLRGSVGLLSGSGFKIVDCITGLLREVLELGHRRILLVMGRATPEEVMTSAVQESTAPIFAENWDGEEVSFSHMIPDLVHPSDWHEWWRMTLTKERPSVVITENVFQAICLNNYCLAHGIQMPRDMSLVVLEDADFLAWLQPSPTRYRHLHEDALRHFRSWVRGGFPHGSIKFLGAELVDGGQTLGPAPR